MSYFSAWKGQSNPFAKSESAGMLLTCGAKTRVGHPCRRKGSGAGGRCLLRLRGTDNGLRRFKSGLQQPPSISP